jgi:Tfp pilus assembly protein PilN
MIRVNLIPVRAKKKRERAERTIVGIAAVLVAVSIILFIVHRVQASEVEQIHAANADLTQKIEKLKQEVGDFEMLKAQREQLMAQRDVIKKLESGRVGPVKVLLELGRLLSQGGQPSMDQKAYEELIRENPSKAYDPTWDPRRLVIISMVERDDGRAQIDGYAKDNSDVAEFIRRLELSKLFGEPYIERTDAVVSSEAAKTAKHVRFGLSVKVNY